MIGGPGEIRTHDLFHAMEARSQLRHRPTLCPAQAIACDRIFIVAYDWDLVKQQLGNKSVGAGPRRLISPKIEIHLRAIPSRGDA